MAKQSEKMILFLLGYINFFVWALINLRDYTPSAYISDRQCRPLMQLSNVLLIISCKR